MEWDWSGFYLAAAITSGLTAIGFVVIVVVMLVFITKDFVIDFIIRHTGGLRGLALFLIGCLGAAAGAVGAMHLLLNFAISLFALADHGRFFGNELHPPAYVVSLLFTLLGGGLFWLFRPFRRIQTKWDDEIVAQKRAAFSRWGSQWLTATGIAVLVVGLMPIFVTMPAWLKKEPGEITLREFLVAGAVGLVWVAADRIRTRAMGTP